MESYWDLYVAYIDYCVRYNYENDIDPHHYRMEWNHFLPRSVFGDQPLGQYLLLKQHSVASCLQSLAFKYLCHCGWHKKHVPEWLWVMAEKAAKNHRKSICALAGKTASPAKKEERYRQRARQKTIDYINQIGEENYRIIASEGAKARRLSIGEERYRETQTIASRSAALKRQRGVEVILSNGVRLVSSSVREMGGILQQQNVTHRGYLKKVLKGLKETPHYTARYLQT